MYICDYHQQYLARTQAWRVVALTLHAAYLNWRADFLLLQCYQLVDKRCQSKQLIGDRLLLYE